MIIQHLRNAAMVACLAIGAIASAEEAGAAVVTWDSSCSADTGSCDNFNSATLGFTAVQADTISWFGDGYFHTHSTTTPTTMSLELLVDGIWQNVFQATTTDLSPTLSNTLSALIVNETFSSGMVSAIRLSADIAWNQTYHGVLFDRFTLDNTVTVPSPATLPLLGVGLAIMGLVGWSRRRRVIPGA